MIRPNAEQLRLPLERPLAGEAFVSSDSNAEAVRVLSRWPDGAGSVLALYGPAGSGKSRLAADWAERVGAVPLNGVEAALVDPLELEGRPVLLDRARDADDESLFHLINLAHTGGGALLLVSRAAPRNWSVALPDLRSRLDAVRTVAVEAPDDRVLSAILRARFAERSIAPTDEVIAYLVRRLDRSADTAATAVERLDALHRPVTRALARQVLDEMSAAVEVETD
ncbi:MAG: chromosomal replication initiator DnaA [Brevundimonas sp. 32-68-21]|nr:chromosomal replication initiator protein DnaA [Brevundimonas sp. BAL3]OGN45822.1 MAG: chromosomal replication initiator DnaA [Caulobacterales bacterium RIFCSPHIGHO2_12_FULL_68_13]OGN45898.1 MAG: chromosomal replication initiator DnaA [Caulobacterales bacterium GWE1_67_11]OGN53495.1 MAG: chromosomal replication initiator DnaA [Caulobacterales bacterium RIFCSPHIGHO2_01_FULL_67_30]OYX81213.1 MAG: chromosomal replication initiator DnaA [Brevundimonas sp. 32-68-21]